jgi:hypothetical protein
MSSSPIGLGSIRVNSLRVGICLRLIVPVERASGDCDLLLAVLERAVRRLCFRRRNIPLDVAPSSEELEEEDESESLVDVELEESLVVMVVRVSVFVSAEEADPRRRCSASPTLSIA